MNRKLIICGGFLGVLSIVLGAFGAHALKEVLTEAQLSSFETGVKYQMYQAIFLLVVSSISFLTNKQTGLLLTLTLIGTVLFSGSIYLLCLQDVLRVKLSFLGPITPIGGSLLILAWSFLVVFAFKQKREKK